MAAAGVASLGFAGATKTLTGALGGYLSGAAIIGAIRRTLDYADSLEKGGGAIDCVPERGGQYKDKRHFHYDIVIPLADFPKGLYVEMELYCPDPKSCPPSVNLLSAHPSRD
jgi:hypothetical protein